MPISQEAPETKHPLQDSVEEIRTLCRLHALPAGRWEDLTNLPFRIAQDAGFRNDIADVVRSLQRRGLNLPDVLDVLVVAVGGPAAPRHSRQLSEQLNLLGGFLSNVGRWPGSESQPILAPGEVPENVQKFTRPQPPASREAPEDIQKFTRSQPPAPGVHVFEAPPLDPPPAAPSRTAAPQQPLAMTQVTDLEAPVSLPDKFPDEPPAIDPNLPITDIIRALSRLERGNLELRAHLDSIDQRISRMEPLIESGVQNPGPQTPAAQTPAPAPRPPAPPLPPTPSPTFTHRDFTRREPVRAQPARIPQPGPEPLRQEPPRQESFRQESFRQELFRGEPLRPEPSRSESLRPEPSRQEPFRPEPLRARPTLPETPRSATPSWPAPPTSPRPEPRAGASSASTPERALGPVPVAAEAAAPAPEPSVSPSASPRFSRYSRNPDFVEAEPEPAPAPAYPSPTSASAERRPVQLPHGFFGTVPDHEAHPLADPATDISARQAPRRQARKLAIAIAVLVLLTLLGVAGSLYRRSTGDAGNGSGASPATTASTSAGAISSQGPLTSAPSKPSAADNARPAAARGVSPSRQSAEDATSSGSFRPAGTFVPSAIMDGHLISAPIPDTSRIPANAGAKGIVVMEVNISSTGVVEDISVLGGNTALRSAAIDAVRNWRYKPYLLNGTPVEVRTIVRVDFNERKSQPAERSAPFPQ